MMKMLKLSSTKKNQNLQVTDQHKNGKKKDFTIKSNMNQEYNLRSASLIYDS